MTLLHDDYAIMAMVEAGLGVSILARLMLLRTHYQISMHSLVPKVFRTIAVAYKSREGLPAASRRFIEFLKEHLPQLP